MIGYEDKLEILLNIDERYDYIYYYETPYREREINIGLICEELNKYNYFPRQMQIDFSSFEPFDIKLRDLYYLVYNEDLYYNIIKGKCSGCKPKNYFTEEEQIIVANWGKFTNQLQNRIIALNNDDIGEDIFNRIEQRKIKTWTTLDKYVVKLMKKNNIYFGLDELLTFNNYRKLAHLETYNIDRNWNLEHMKVNNCFTRRKFISPRDL